jgi:hypothetical protein
MGSMNSGLTTTSAPSVITPVTTAISVSGTACRTVLASESTSREVLVSRSPEPARSTVDSGSPSTRSTNSSRSSASTFSPSLAEASTAYRTSTLCSSRKAPMPRAMATGLTWAPVSTSWTRPPSCQGTTSPAAAASPCRARATPS